uniref:G_PROTEIN_RECEP_F1_2 domain-containing protein n=1 Tax=Rhabditophanes sp. KR3021 TaxID=114890 RepID=A0AC35TGD8_9BILA
MAIINLETWTFYANILDIIFATTCFAASLPNFFKLIKNKPYHMHFKYCLLSLFVLLNLRALSSVFHGTVSLIKAKYLSPNNETFAGYIVYFIDPPTLETYHFKIFVTKFLELIQTVRSTLQNTIRCAMAIIIVERLCATRMHKSYETKNLGAFFFVLVTTLIIIISYAVLEMRQFSAVFSYFFYYAFSICLESPIPLLYYFLCRQNKKLQKKANAITRNLSEKYQNDEIIRSINETNAFLTIIVFTQVITNIILLISSIFSHFAEYRFFLIVASYAFRDASTTWSFIYLYFNNCPALYVIRKVIRCFRSAKTAPINIAFIKNSTTTGCRRVVVAQVPPTPKPTRLPEALKHEIQNLDTQQIAETYLKNLKSQWN